ncbi:MAG: pseudouridine synthase, partial [Bacteroidota bacterium]
ITCTTDQRDKTNIIDFIGYSERIFPIGRLDKPSTGLILLTNDGDIVNEILREENAHEKEYIVKVDRPVSDHFVKKMAGGLPILGTRTKKCKVERVNKFVFRIILTQGLNRQIRRMCELLNYKVVSLKRVRVMHMTLGDLPVGQWRKLTKIELEELYQRVR